MLFTTRVRMGLTRSSFCTKWTFYLNFLFKLDLPGEFRNSFLSIAIFHFNVQCNLSRIFQRTCRFYSHNANFKFGSPKPAFLCIMHDVYFTFYIRSVISDMSWTLLIIIRSDFNRRIMYYLENKFFENDSHSGLQLEKLHFYWQK